jgi:hypothetical protein
MNVPQAQSPMFEHVLALEGRTVLYIEKMSLFRVVVAEVRPSEDGQGFDCLATFVPTPGMVSKRATWRFGAGWNYFHATPQKVNSTYGGWRIYTEAVVIDEALEILKDVPEGRSYKSDLEWTPVHGDSMVTSTGSPGQIAKRVHEFLRNH